MTDQVIQVAVDRDKSTGLATVTIRLSGWSLKELLRFASALWTQPETGKVGRALSARLDSGRGR